MKLIKNTGNDRVMDALRSGLSATPKLDIATPAFSAFAFAEFAAQLQGLCACRLDRLKKLCIGRDLTDDSACARFDKTTRNGENMSATQQLLAKAVASIVGKKEERAVASLFTPGGTHAMKGEFAGINDFEVVAFLVVLPGQTQ